MAKKNNNIAIAISVGIAGLSYWLYTQYTSGTGLFKKKPPTVPKAEPITSMAPTTTKTIYQKVPDYKIADLQSLMIQRALTFIPKINYTTADAKGGWGPKSRTALSLLRPETFKNYGDVSLTNIDLWIKALKDDLSKVAKEQANMSAKQNTQSTNESLSKKLEDGVKKGLKAELIQDVVVLQHIYDNLTGTYKALSDTKQYKKGRQFRELKSRGNGQIMILDGDYRYPTSPSNFILRQ
jgi:hypothetical protein